MKNTIKVHLLGIGLLLLPPIALAETSDNSNEVTKEVWLAQVKQAVAEPICKSFIDDESIAAQMSANNLSYDKCLTVIPALADKCEQKYASSLPAKINHDIAQKWGRLIGECIGNGFASDYLNTNAKAKKAAIQES